MHNHGGNCEPRKPSEVPSNPTGRVRQARIPGQLTPFLAERTPGALAPTVLVRVDNGTAANRKLWSAIVRGDTFRLANGTPVPFQAVIVERIGVVRGTGKVVLDDQGNRMGYDADGNVLRHEGPVQVDSQGEPIPQVIVYEVSGSIDAIAALDQAARNDRLPCIIGIPWLPISVAVPFIGSGACDADAAARARKQERKYRPTQQFKRGLNQ